MQQDGYVIKYIKNPSEAVQLAAVEYEGLTLDYIENPTENVQFQAIEYDPWNLACIKNPLPDVVIKAIESDVEILDSIEDWVDDEEIMLDRSSEGLEEGLRKYAIDLLETEELEMLYKVCRVLYEANIQKKKSTITIPNGNKFEEPIYTSLLDVVIHFLVKFTKESGNEYYYFEDLYNYLLNDIDLFQNMSKPNGLETLVEAGGGASISPDYRYAASMSKIDFSNQRYIEFLESVLMDWNCEVEVISYCILEFNGDLFLMTFEYGE